MAANTLSEIVGCEITAEVDDGYMNIRVRSELSEAQQILEGLRLHLVSLAGDYPDNIKVI